MAVILLSPRGRYPTSTLPFLPLRNNSFHSFARPINKIPHNLFFISFQYCVKYNCSIKILTIGRGFTVEFITFARFVTFCVRYLDIKFLIFYRETRCSVVCLFIIYIYYLIRPKPGVFSVVNPKTCFHN